MFGYIYETTNLINGKTYIGKRQGSFDNTYYGSGMILKQALKKYGRSNFKISVLAEYDTECELNNAEIMFIEKYNPVYNIAKGGTGGDTLARASMAYKQSIINKRTVALKTVHSTLTADERQAWNKAISEAKKGIASNRPGYKHSDDVKQRIAESNRNAIKSETWKENHAKAAEARIGIPNAKCFKPVQFNEVVYEGITIAATKLNVSVQTIHNWIKKGKMSYVN